MSDDALAPTGGCLCGAVRYRLARVPDDVAHCHCSLCRRASGAPVVTWATLARADLTLVAGRPHWYRSSQRSRRGFCPDCGTQLFFAQDAEAPVDLADPASAEAGDIDVTVASLDTPETCIPTRNIWVGTRLGFLDGFDRTLPDHADEGPTPTPPAQATDR